MKGRLAGLEQLFKAVEAERLKVTEGTPYRYFLEGFGQGLHIALDENAGVSSSKEVAESRERERRRIEEEEKQPSVYSTPTSPFDNERRRIEEKKKRSKSG